jgi:predicted nucleotidyltransferase
MLRRLFSSKVRIELLSTLFSFLEKDFYPRELARLTGEDFKNISRELTNLEELGLVSSRRDGNRKYFHLNKSFFLFNELKSMLLKTRGVAGLLKDALSGQKGIAVAFLYGSFAAGIETEKSDVDLMIFGNISLDKLLKLIREPEKKLAREINPTVYDAAEIKSRIKQKNSFLAQVLQGPKIMLIGSENDLRGIAG